MWFLMLPEPEHRPSFGSKASVGVLVARNVCRNLYRPIIGVVLENFSTVIRATVPEAPVNKYRNTSPREHNVCFTAYVGDWCDRNSIPKATPVQSSPDC
jgi:hypothetical protein